MKNGQLSLILLGLLASVLFAATTNSEAQVTPSADAYTNSASAGTNFGTAVTLGAVSSGASMQHSYIQFDLSSIPSGFNGSNVAKATLKLYVNAVTTSGSFNVDFVTGPWAEKTITANLSPSLGTTVAGSVPLTSALVHDYVLVDVTPAVVAWLNGTQANDGLALVANSPLNATFDSKENITQSHAPELDIVFTGGLSGATLTAGGGLVGGVSGGVLNVGMLRTCSTNQILQWNGTAWTCATVSGGGGSITGVTAGTDLTGGGTSGNVTLNLNTTALQTANDARYAQLGAADAFTQTLTVASANQVAVRATSSASSASVIYGHSTDTSGAPNEGVLGIADGSSGVGIMGYSSGSAGTGVEGNGKMNGVLGFATVPSTRLNTFSTVGVHGDTGIATGIGVLGTVDNGTAVGGVAGLGVGVYGSGTTAGVYGATNATGGNANGVRGLSFNATAVHGDDTGNGTGVVGGSVSGIGVQGSGVGAGVYGITTASGGSANGVQGASTNATAVRGDDGGSGSGVVGTSVSGYGVYGSSSSGFSFGADNNATQARGAGGWVKAMVLVDPFAPGGIAIIRCFNAQQTGAAVYTAPCGMTIVSHTHGDNILDLGFQVSDRFPSATAANAAEIGATAVGANQIEIVTANVNGVTDVPFYLFVY